MQGFIAPIERLTECNTDFRRVLYTAPNMQLVLMALRPKEDIGSETHATHDQFFRIEKGKGSAVIGHAEISVRAGDAFVVPAGVEHNLTNTGKKLLRLYTIYSPPNHVDHLIEPTKAIAEADERSKTAVTVAETARKDMIDEGGPVDATIAASTRSEPT